MQALFGWGVQKQNYKKNVSLNQMKKEEDDIYQCHTLNHVLQPRYVEERL